MVARCRECPAGSIILLFPTSARKAHSIPRFRRAEPRRSRSLAPSPAPPPPTAVSKVPIKPQGLYRDGASIPELPLMARNGVRGSFAGVLESAHSQLTRNALLVDWLPSRSGNGRWALWKVTTPTGPRRHTFHKRRLNLAACGGRCAAGFPQLSGGLLPPRVCSMLTQRWRQQTRSLMTAEYYKTGRN